MILSFFRGPQKLKGRGSKAPLFYAQTESQVLASLKCTKHLGLPPSQCGERTDVWDEFKPAELDACIRIYLHFCLAK